MAGASGSPQQWQLTLVQLTTVLVPALLLLLLLLLLARKRRAGTSGSSSSWRGRRLLHLPPGPPRLPILGNLHQLGALPHQSLRELARRHGPVMLLRLGTVPTLVVSSAEAAREVMKVHDADCCSRPDTPGARRLSYDHKDVAFSPYGDYWREMRKLFVVEFLSARRVRAADYAREAEVDKLIGRLSRAGGKPVQLEDHIFALMDGFIGTVAFGSIYGTEQFAHKKHFHDVLDEAMRAKAGFSAEDFYPNAAGRLLDRLTGAAARRERVFRDLDAFFDTIIDQHLQVDPCSRATTTPGGHGGPDLIDVFVDLMKERRQVHGSHRFTRDHIKGLLSNVFNASVDTSAVTMVWAMAELIRRPAMLRKAQEEVRSVVDGGGRERVHPDDVPKLRYLKAVVKETLRLHPAVPLLLPRETLRHVSVCGYDVPAKTRVLVNAWAIGRDPRSWGDRSEEFDPDRFDGDGDGGGVGFNGTHFELAPFGAGRRMCPGMGMGVATVEFTLANLLYCFDWELPDGVAVEDVSMEEAGGLSVHKKTPLLLVPTRYKCASSLADPAGSPGRPGTTWNLAQKAISTSGQPMKTWPTADLSSTRAVFLT